MWARVKRFFNLDMVQEVWQITRMARQANQSLKQATEEHVKAGQKAIELGEQTIAQGKLKQESLEQAAKKLDDASSTVKDFIGGFSQMEKDPAFKDLQKSLGSSAKGGQDMLAGLRQAGLGVADILNPQGLSPERQKAVTDVMMKSVEQNPDLLKNLKIEDIQKMQEMMSKVPFFKGLASKTITPEDLARVKDMVGKKK